MSGPVIVTGPDRSGTTLLYQLLASHPRLSMVRRTNMFRWFYGRFGDLGNPANLEACLDTMLRYERLGALRPDRSTIESEFAQGEPTYGTLFAIMHRQEAERRGKARWGDKSLHHEHHAADIFHEWPAASMIHLIRDPRDRHASVTKRYAERKKGIGSVTGRWLASTRAGEMNTTRYPDRYLLVRYEDLVHDTTSVLERVCGVIGEPFDPAMLRMDGAFDADAEGNSSFEEVPVGTISTRSIGRFRDILSPSEIRFIEDVARGPLETHGYQPVRPGVGLGYQLRYLPESYLRMRLWMIRDAGQRRRGAEVPMARLRPEGIG